MQIKYYLDSKKNLDKYYGIQKRDDHYIMGDKIVTIDDKSNITVNGENFTSSPGL